MAKIVYLHLGLHKTATGWLQRQFFPRLGLPLHRTRKLEKIAALAAAPGAERIIVSHEGLGGRITDDKAPGDSLRTFHATLDGLPRIPAEMRVLIGFREHASWLSSAYAQRGKKTVVTPEEYRASYSPEDLSWMTRVALCDQAGAQSFLFLYEEFARDPIALCEDLCRFLGVAMPNDIEALLANRENPSPRSERGLRVARAAHGLARLLGALPFVDAKRLRQRASALGASFDGDGADRVAVPVTGADRQRFSDDWRHLVGIVSQRRGTDLAALVEAAGKP